MLWLNIKSENNWISCVNQSKMWVADQQYVYMFISLVVKFLLQVIAKKMPSDQLQNFMEVLQEGLLDPQSHSSSGACVVLNGMMKIRGAEILKQVGPTCVIVPEQANKLALSKTHHFLCVTQNIFYLGSYENGNNIRLWISSPCKTWETCIIIRLGYYFKERNIIYIAICSPCFHISGFFWIEYHHYITTKLLLIHVHIK